MKSRTVSTRAISFLEWYGAMLSSTEQGAADRRAGTFSENLRGLARFCSRIAAQSRVEQEGRRTRPNIGKPATFDGQASESETFISTSWLVVRHGAAPRCEAPVSEAVPVFTSKPFKFSLFSLLTPLHVHPQKHHHSPPTYTLLSCQRMRCRRNKAGCHIGHSISDTPVEKSSHGLGGFQ